MAITPQEAADEIRYRAARLRLEMDPPHDMSSSDHKGFPVTLLLSLALIDAANAEWEARMAKWIAADKAGRAQRIYDRALKLARPWYNVCLADEIKYLLTNGVPGASAIVANVSARFNGKDLETKPVLCLQSNLYDLKPLWAQYLKEATLQIDEEDAAEAAQAPAPEETL